MLAEVLQQRAASFDRNRLAFSVRRHRAKAVFTAVGENQRDGGRDTGPDGIVFGQGSKGILRVSPNGGKPQG